MNDYEKNVEVLLSQIEVNTRSVDARLELMSKRIAAIEEASVATQGTLGRWFRRRTGVVSIAVGLFLGLVLTGLAWIVFGGIFRAMLSMH